MKSDWDKVDEEEAEKCTHKIQKQIQSKKSHKKCKSGSYDHKSNIKYGDMLIKDGTIDQSQQPSPANINEARENSIKHKKITDFHN